MSFQSLLVDYLAGAGLLRKAVAGMTREQLLARPIAGKWSTQEVVCHLADFEPIYADRMKRVIAEDGPRILSGDPYLVSRQIGLRAPRPRRRVGHYRKYSSAGSPYSSNSYLCGLPTNGNAFHRWAAVVGNVARARYGSYSPPCEVHLGKTDRFRLGKLRANDRCFPETLNANH